MSAEMLQRVRAATPYAPPDYFRRLTKAEIFPDPATPLEVDLGCGDGGFLIDLAAAHPGRNFLGVEKLLGRARKVARKAAWRGLANVKVLRLESAYAVGYLLPLQSVARLHLLFPDPWPKAKHQRHRLVQPAFCAAVHGLLEPSGEWYFKTDHGEYFNEALGTIRESGRFEEVAWCDGSPGYPTTDFERQWLSEGRAIHRARFRAREP